VITSEFKKNCTPEELGMLHMILLDAFSLCNYEPSFNCISLLRKDVATIKLEALKGKILPQHITIIETLQKKLTVDI